MKFDAGIVACSVLDQWLIPALDMKIEFINFTVFRVFRLLRLLKLLRLVKH